MSRLARKSCVVAAVVRKMKASNITIQTILVVAVVWEMADVVRKMRATNIIAIQRILVVTVTVVTAIVGVVTAIVVVIFSCKYSSRQQQR